MISKLVSPENRILKAAWQMSHMKLVNLQIVFSWWTWPISCSISSALWQYSIQLGLCWLQWDSYQLHLRNHVPNSTLPGSQQGSRQRHWNNLKQNPVRSLFPKRGTEKQQKPPLSYIMLSIQEASKYLCHYITSFGCSFRFSSSHVFTKWMFSV